MREDLSESESIDDFPDDSAMNGCSDPSGLTTVPLGGSTDQKSVFSAPLVAVACLAVTTSGSVSRPEH